MKKAIDKHLILLFSLIFVIQTQSIYAPVVAFLAAVISVELSIYFEKQIPRYIISAVFVILCFPFPSFVFFIPAILYEHLYRKEWWAFSFLVLFPVTFDIFDEPWKIMMWWLLVVLVFFLSYRTRGQTEEHAAFIALRDQSVEEQGIMKKRNRELLEKQDYEVRVATLSERNRIAREIHDNVGHMLSRCILQLGALMVVYKEQENIYEQLSSVNKSLNEAMNNIRESVHDLHDESVDLKQSILEATSEMKKNYNLRVDYDMSDNVPRGVKFAMIAIVKEAMANIVKHSNASKVSVMLREHPGFYQLVIEDNGSNIRKNMNPGIGLTNMRDRVEALNGSINFRSDSGFVINVSINKETNKK